MKLFATLAGMLAGALLLLSPAPAAASSHTGWCERIEIPVALGPNQPKNQTVTGTHCTPSSPSIVRSIDVLIPGGSYNSTYWDFPYNNYQYSYVDRTINANRATFNLDRIGTGESSKPLSAQITLNADAHTVHQVIKWLKNNRNYNDITTVGHSLGSAVALQEAATYKDVNRVVATGFLHAPSIKLIATAGTMLYPAALDPQFAGKILDLGYLTTIPGKRANAFYSSAADPGVANYDEASKDVFSAVELEGIVTATLLPPALNSSQHITVPVLTILGEEDLFCDALIGASCSSSASIQAYENPYFPNAASFEAHVVPQTAHNLPLHPSADGSFNTINNWINAH